MNEYVTKPVNPQQLYRVLALAVLLVLVAHCLAVDKTMQGLNLAVRVVCHLLV